MFKLSDVHDTFWFSSFENFISFPNEVTLLGTSEALVRNSTQNFYKRWFSSLRLWLGNSLCFQCVLYKRQANYQIKNTRNGTFDGENDMGTVQKYRLFVGEGFIAFLIHSFLLTLRSITTLLPTFFIFSFILQPSSYMFHLYSSVNIKKFINPNGP